MRRNRTALIASGLVLALALGGAALGAPPAEVALKRLKVKPFVFDPDATGIVSSRWVTHQGLADAGKSDHALVLKKEGTTATNASSGGSVHGVKNLALTELGFDYEVGGHCGAGAPRFNVTLVDGTVFFFGCIHGDVVETLTDRDGDMWNRVRFTDADAFPADGLSVWPSFGTAQAQAVHVVFDEGNDVGVGFTRLDNIDVNGKLMGKPGAGVPKKQH
ncbi:MAG: hypothetical protein ACRDKA_09790 [Actinomycetota bacterium]